MRMLLKAAIVASMIGAAPVSSALAEDCPDANDRSWVDMGRSHKYPLPSSDERHQILDLFSRYAWMVDNQDVDVDVDGVSTLFVPDAQYLLCKIGGTKPEKTLSLEDYRTSLRAQYKLFSASNTRTRRLYSNVLIGRVNETNDFEARASSVVFIQSIDLAPPQADYMASVYATVTKDKDNALKFKYLKVITDQTGISVLAR